MILRNPNREPEWESANATELYNFLHQTKTGERLLARLLWCRPRYSTEIDKRIVESGMREGFEDAIEELLSLCELVKERKEATNYPDLDHDEAWEGIVPKSE